MFTIDLELSVPNLSGLEALDLRRKLGLTDGNRVYYSCGYTRDVTVSEGFARAYFDQTQNHKRQTVPADLLAAGDVVVNDSYRLCWNPEITDGRILELWLTCELKRTVVMS